MRTEDTNIPEGSSIRIFKPVGDLDDDLFYILSS